MSDFVEIMKEIVFENKRNFLIIFLCVAAILVIGHKYGGNDCYGMGAASGIAGMIAINYTHRIGRVRKN